MRSATRTAAIVPRMDATWLSMALRDRSELRNTVHFSQMSAENWDIKQESGVRSTEVRITHDDDARHALNATVRPLVR